MLFQKRVEGVRRKMPLKLLKLNDWENSDETRHSSMAIYYIYFHFSLGLILPLACFGDYFIQLRVTDQFAAAVNIYMTYKYKNWKSIWIQLFKNYLIWYFEKYWTIFTLILKHYRLRLLLYAQKQHPVLFSLLFFSIYSHRSFSTVLTFKALST